MYPPAYYVVVRRMSDNCIRTHVANDSLFSGDEEEIVAVSLAGGDAATHIVHEIGDARAAC